MRYVLDDVEVKDVSGEIERGGVKADRRVRVTVETLEEDLPMASLAEEGRAFAFLADEPDLYSESDIKR
ncbi:MAG TPA: hypothetical protein VG387_05595 [Rhizomicrobium sp.]|jgi:hypothetical protein|nr:hypothetical protein [Rhizomicrobium sp.]